MATIAEVDARRDRALTFLEDVVISFGEPERPQFIQEMPVRMTVWRSFASDPHAEHGLLIEPNHRIPSNVAILKIRQALAATEIQENDVPFIAMRNRVYLSATMDQFFAAIFPSTVWFRNKVLPGLESWLQSLEKIESAKNLKTMRIEFREAPQRPLWRFLAAWSVIKVSDDWATKEAQKKRLSPSDRQLAYWGFLEETCESLLRVTEVEDLRSLTEDFSDDVFKHVSSFTSGMANKFRPFVEAAKAETKKMPAEGDGPAQAPIWSVDLNRPIELAINLSRNTVKIDAAERVFEGSTSGICWAVIDSGIDATHPAFAERTSGRTKPVKKIDPGDSRIVATYDFNRLTALFKEEYEKLVPEGEIKRLKRSLKGKFREQVKSLDDAILIALYQKNSPRVPNSLSQRSLPQAIRDRSFREEVKGYVGEIKSEITGGAMIDWALMEPLLRMPHIEGPYQEPGNYHGTHVAGIIAGSLPARSLSFEDDIVGPEHPVMGMCPDLRLIDLRVCDSQGKGDEFLVMAALQFIDYLNKSQDRMRVHGANLSLSIRHLVRNYGCGQTPVCREANYLVANGVIVVAAAGNRGFERLQTETGFVDNYSWSSITDPGNAEDVITVGATHRSKPYTYGVSYFSSRGPTGDGRQKPDLVAPGEKINAPVPGPELRVDNGTSMAAPHVSGAAALLLARYPEFIGQPLKIKEILCEAATDLGRRKEFQGAGLVDVLRALQSV